MSTTTYICPRHQCEQPKRQSCQACVQEWDQLPSPAEMTGDARATEMRQREIATVPFGLIHARIEALVGRPVFTHEMGLAWDALVEEARTWDHPHPRQAIKMLKDHNIDFVVVEVPGDES